LAIPKQFCTALLCSLFVLAGCSSSNLPGEFISGTHQNRQIEISDDIPPDSAMAAAIAPYAERLESRMQRELVISTGIFTKDKPEGTLGNLIADITRRRASLELKTWVDMSVINNGGLRRPLYEGSITVGDIYELMPFENTLVVLKMTGQQVQKLAGQLAQIGGEPVSGLRMRIENREARDIMVGSRTVMQDSTYWVATNSYLANGGGDMPALHHPKERIDTGVTIRRMIIDYLDDQQKLEPKKDFRIRQNGG